MLNHEQNEMQEIADINGFDLKNIPYGYQFRMGKFILNYYNTTGSVVTSKPKSKQQVKKHVPISKIGSMLKELKSEIETIKPITGEQAINLVISGVSIKHKRLGEVDWRKDDIKNLPLNSFLNKTFVFELGE